MKLLDTTVAVDHLRGRAKATDVVLAELESDEPLPASEVVRFELVAGARHADVDYLIAATALVLEAELLTTNDGTSRCSGA